MKMVTLYYYSSKTNENDAKQFLEELAKINDALDKVLRMNILMTVPADTAIY